MPLQPETVFIPLALGMSGKVDPRALSAPELAICRDAQFDDEGGLQPRLPFDGLSMAIVGGGTISETRRLAVNGDELLLFTRDKLYAWSEADQAWSLRTEYLAPDVVETPVYSRSGDQLYADQAELAGVILTTWIERSAGGDAIHIAARDAATGAILLSPATIIGVGGVGAATRPRVVAQATRFLFVYFDDSGATDTIYANQIDPANLAADVASINATPTAISFIGEAAGPFDVTVRAGGDAYVALLTTVPSYRIVRITDAFVRTNASKSPLAAQDAIAVATSAAGTEMTVVRFNGSTIRADRINPSTLASVSTDTSLGAPDNLTVNQLTAAYRDVADGGQFRCYAFWSCGEQVSGISSSTFIVQQAYIDTAGAVGGQFDVMRRVGLASRAFCCDGRVFVWTVFAMESGVTGMGEPLGFRAAFQNTLFLLRDGAADFEAWPIAKACDNFAGGHGPIAGHLPGVQLTGTREFAFCATDRRIVVLSDTKTAGTATRKVQTAYADRGPREVRLTLDANAARRVVRLGRTLYLSGAIVSQYDGEAVVEVGFHVFPWYFLVAAVAGALPAGTYVFKSTESWQNGASEFERSTTASGTSITLTAGQEFSLLFPHLHLTAKKGSRTPVSLEVWRTEANPPEGADHHLVTSLDPAAGSGDNRHVANDATSGGLTLLVDALTDDELRKRERSPENGGVLENLPPVGAPVIAATQDRVLLARGRTLFYSKLREPGEVVAFHDLLRLDLPDDGGDITGLTFQDETLVAFCERGIFSVPGIGLDNRGSGQNYGPAQVRSIDVGAVSQEAIARTPRGILFKSRKGWYLLDGWRPMYIGQAVAGFDGDEVRSIDVVESQHQVRIFTGNRVLVWDYETNRERGGSWSEWTLPAPIHSVIWQGRQVVIDDGDLYIQSEDFSSLSTAGLDVETGWFRPSEWQGYRRIWDIVALAEYRGPCRIRMRLKRDYNEATYFDDVHWTPTPAVVGAPLQFHHNPSIQQCQALKVRLTVEHPTIDGNPPVSSEGARFTGISILYGADPGHIKRLPAAQSI